MNTGMENTIETAIFGNGCFWCTEAVFQQLKGVTKVTSGYSGGDIPDPDYKSVCTGTTGHAECIKIEYDTKELSFEEVLEVFWKTHDPTTLNRQGNDIGTQYRSVIFYGNDSQKSVGENSLNQLKSSGGYTRKLVTTLEPLTRFFPAEAQHQNYYILNANAPYCHFVVRPKVEKFLKHFSSKIKS